MMRTILLVALAVSLVTGCSSTPPLADGPYSGIPSVPSDEPIATAQPVIPTGNPRLDDFLSHLAAAIDRKDWLGVARMMDADEFAQQHEFLSGSDRDAPAAQVIAESLGIGSLYHDDPGWAGLDRIRVVTFRQHAVQTPGIAGGEGFDVIEGTVRLDSGSTLPLSFLIAFRDGVHVVVVPAG